MNLFLLETRRRYVKKKNQGMFHYSCFIAIGIALLFMKKVINRDEEAQKIVTSDDNKSNTGQETEEQTNPSKDTPTDIQWIVLQWECQ